MIRRVIRQIFKNKKILLPVIFIVTVSIFFINAIFQEKDEYVDQKEIKNYQDNYFNTTPRQKINERIVVLYRNDGVIEVKTTLDAKGREVKQEEKLLYKLQNNQIITRENSILRVGDEILNGDVLEKKYIMQGGNIIEESKVIQNSKIETQRVAINKDDYTVLPLSSVNGLTEISSESIEIDGKSFVKKTFVDKNGNKYYEIFDKEGNKLPEGYKISAKTIIGKNGKQIQEKAMIIQNGNIIEKISNIRDVEEGDITKIDKEGNHNLIKNERTNLSAEDELKILELQRRRLKNSKSKIIIPENNVTKRLEELKNNNNNFSTLYQEELFESDKVIPSFPTDLSRVLTSDKLITAVIRTAINTQVPTKKILAMVDANVYATHGRKILIPSGSSVIGHLQPIQNTNDQRVNIVWKRILTPEGININLNAELNDELGNSGLGGAVDNRWYDRYGVAFLTSFMNATAQISIPVDNERYRATAESFTGEFSQLTAQLIREGVKVLPTIRIKQGTRINISPIEDIWFKSGKDGEVDVIQRSQLNKPNKSKK
jgi:type IV secretion system protein VirB10